MRSKFKVGIVGMVAALLVGIGAFGLGGATTSQADIKSSSVSCAGPSSPTANLCVFTTTEHGLDPIGPGSTTAVDPQPLPAYCQEAAGRTHIDTNNYPPVGPTTSTIPHIVIPTGGSILICVNAQGVGDHQGGETVAHGDLAFDSNDNGFWDRPACGYYGESGPDNAGSPDGDARIAEWPDDRCAGPIGTNTDFMIIPSDPPGPGVNDLTTVIVRYNCSTFVGRTLVTIQQDQNRAQFNISCRTNPDDISLTCSPCTVEIVPARSNTAHSLIQVEAVYNAPGPDSDNDFTLTGMDVDFKTDRCAIETAAFTDEDYLYNYERARFLYRALNVAIPDTYYDFNKAANYYGIDETANSFGGSAQVDTGKTFDVDLNVDGTVAAAWLHCDVHSGVTTATPGVATVSACWEVVNAADLCKFITVTVIGPPASITVAASPTSLRCGEKSTITATVKDAIGQNVSDHTRVEFVTNLGGTLAGTGGVAGFAGPVVPISSNVGDTFGGVATAFLITSEVTSGPYEVVATSGGTSSSDYGTGTYLGGVFSTPPVSAQVTVTCNIPVAAAPAPAPTITAPRTGTGITPPNTGDAGLADTSGASWTLFAIGGIVALSLAGFATAKAARR